MSEVPTPHIPPEPGTKLHDRRGALALAALGAIGLGGSSYYSVTEMEFPDMWLVTMIMGLSSPLSSRKLHFIAFEYFVPSLKM